MEFGGYPAACLDLMLGADVADGLDDLDQAFDKALGGLVDGGEVGLGIGGDHDGLRRVIEVRAQALPEFLGDEGHEGVQQPQGVVQHLQQHRQRRGAGAGLEADLGQLDIPVAELAPDEIMDGAFGLAELEVFHVGDRLGNRAAEAGQDPAVLGGQGGFVDNTRRRLYRDSR